MEDAARRQGRGKAGEAVTPHAHLASIDPDLVGDWLERAAIRVVLGGQREAEAMRAAYEETCRRVGVEPLVPPAPH